MNNLPFHLELAGELCKVFLLFLTHVAVDIARVASRKSIFLGTCNAAKDMVIHQNGISPDKRILNPVVRYFDV